MHTSLFGQRSLKDVPAQKARGAEKGANDTLSLSGDGICTANRILPVPNFGKQSERRAYAEPPFPV